MKLDDKAPAIPCGLRAKSLFNDTFFLKKDGGENQEIKSKGIAWDTDKDYRYNNIKENLPEGKEYKDLQWLDMEDGKLTLTYFIINILYF